MIEQPSKAFINYSLVPGLPVNLTYECCGNNPYPVPDRIPFLRRPFALTEIVPFKTIID
jgi:hypothetical protein